jgi:hypothetical protein
LWFQLVLFLPGLYASHFAAQGGAGLEETPFYSPQTAAAQLAAMRDVEGVGPALLYFFADTINAVLLCSALAALIGLGVRSLNLQRSPFRYLVVIPFAMGAADISENIQMGVAVVFSAMIPLVASVAGYVTGAKFLLFVPAALLALAGAAAGGGVTVLRRIRRA